MDRKFPSHAGNFVENDSRAHSRLLSAPEFIWPSSLRYIRAPRSAVSPVPTEAIGMPKLPKSMFGTEDNDLLTGGNKNDKLFGDGGNDGLAGGAGRDELDAGA